MTAGDMPIGDFTYPVTTDLSGKQYYAVYVTSSNILIATASYPMMGILQDNPNGATKATVGSVRELGHSKCWVDGSTIVAGSPLKVSSTAGKLGLGTLTTDIIVAVALEANGSATGIIEVALTNRNASGVSFRAGQLTYNIVQTGLTASKAVYTAIPLGFTGSIVGWYGIYTTASGSSSGAGTLDLLLTTTATPRQLYTTGTTTATLTLTHNSAVGTVVAGGAPTVNNSFVPTDTLEIHYTQGTTFSGDTGVLEVHIITN